jgi:Domain of unknown function (DUF5655)
VGWACPSCGRQFGRRNQSHECEPAMSLDDYFATGPPRERPIFEAVRAHLESIGPVQIEPVAVGIFIKKEKSFVELRSKRNWVALSFPLTRVVEHSKIARTIRSGARTFHFVNLRGPEDVDDDVRAWLTESYLEASD